MYSKNNNKTLSGDNSSSQLQNLNNIFFQTQNESEDILELKKLIAKNQFINTDIVKILGSDILNMSDYDKITSPLYDYNWNNEHIDWVDVVKDDAVSSTFLISLLYRFRNKTR